MTTPSPESMELKAMIDPRARTGVSPSTNLKPTSRRLSLASFGMGLVRVFLVSGAISLLTLTLRIHSARAALTGLVERFVMAEARGDFSLPGPGTGARLLINGAPLALSSRHSHDTQEALRRSFLEVCPSARSFSGSILDRPQKGDATNAPGFTAICLRDGDGRPVSSLVDWFTSLGASKRSSHTSARVLFARELPPEEQPAAPPRGSQVVEIELAPTSLLTAFPPEGDAPGFDPSFAPRPQGRRLLSVMTGDLSGTTPKELAFAYETAQSAEDALREFDQRAQERGDLRVVTRGARASAYRGAQGLFEVVASPTETGSLLLVLKAP